LPFHLSRPLVSIVIPSFNQGAFIMETLRSCLDQSYRPIEIIIQDGGSTDQTVSILRALDAPEVKWTSEPDAGVVDAVNKGLRRAAGEILTIQSSDDLFYDEGVVAAAVDALSNDPGIGLVYGDVELINEHSQVIGVDRQGAFDLAEYFARLMYVPQSGTFFSASALTKVGGWREEFSYAADADLWFRIALQVSVVKLDRMMGRYRYHALQRDQQREKICRDWEKMILDLTPSLDRRIQRKARSGVFLARYRYADPHDWVKRTRWLYSALLLNPSLLTHAAFPARELLPGREPIWRRLSRIKRALGFKPRGTQRSESL
jgi:glycosyltransferase involved in cell wall biosynthesis